MVDSIQLGMMLGKMKNADEKTALRRLGQYVKRELGSWSLFHYVFDAGLTLVFGLILLLVKVLTDLSWWIFWGLVISLALTVFSGTVLFRRMIRDLRTPLLPKQNVAKERRRLKHARKIIQDLIDEGEQGAGWSKEETMYWIYKVECAIRPLFEQAEAQGFKELFGGGNVASDQVRERCLVWLRSACLKYWL